MTSPRRPATLDPRAWLLWGTAASAPAFLGRNPFPLLTVLVIVLAVRMTWPVNLGAGRSFAFILRLSLLFTAISVVFNALTVHSGDWVLFTIPASIPIFGGDVTPNAILFGVLSGSAAMTIVATWVTVAGQLNWHSLLRLAPDRLLSFAVSASVAISFVPMTLVAFREVREAQSIRGHQFRGWRDLAPIVGPVLSGSLDRAMSMAESLESRGFGLPACSGMHPCVPSLYPRSNRWRGLLLMLTLAAAIIAVFSLSTGRDVPAVIAGTVSAGAIIGLMLTGRKSPVSRTRYREPVWSWRDTAVVIGSLLALAAVVVSLLHNEQALRYEPYPVIEWPVVSVPLLLSLAGLLVPLALAPAGAARQVEVAT